MQLFLKDNIVKILLAIFAWAISILSWFFPKELTNSPNLSQQTYRISAMLSFIIAILLSYAVYRSILKFKSK